MYGGMGGMGGMGMGGYGGGMYGQPGMMGNGDPNDPNSLTNTFSQSTQATFQIIESLVGAFGGFAQMLESTYMATHSSFFGQSSPLLRFHLVSKSAISLRVEGESSLTTDMIQQWYKLPNNSPHSAQPSDLSSASSPSSGGSAHSSLKSLVALRPWTPHHSLPQRSHHSKAFLHLVPLPYPMASQRLQKNRS